MISQIPNFWILCNQIVLKKSITSKQTILVLIGSKIRENPEFEICKQIVKPYGDSSD